MPLFWTPTPTLDYLEISDSAYLTMTEFRLDTPLRPARKIVTIWGEVERNGRMTIYARYPWDGASGPTIDTSDSIIPSLVHDFGYQLIRLGFLRRADKEIVDRLFYELLLAQGMVQFRAFAWWRAVVRFGFPAINPDQERPILRVPRPVEVVERKVSPLVGYPA